MNKHRLILNLVLALLVCACRGPGKSNFVQETETDTTTTVQNTAEEYDIPDQAKVEEGWKRTSPTPSFVGNNNTSWSPFNG